MPAPHQLRSGSAQSGCGKDGGGGQYSPPHPPPRWAGEDHGVPSPGTASEPFRGSALPSSRLGLMALPCRGLFVLLLSQPQPLPLRELACGAIKGRPHTCGQVSAGQVVAKTVPVSPGLVPGDITPDTWPRLWVSSWPLKVPSSATRLAAGPRGSRAASGLTVCRGPRKGHGCDLFSCFLEDVPDWGLLQRPLGLG